MSNFCKKKKQRKQQIWLFFFASCLFLVHNFPHTICVLRSHTSAPPIDDFMNDDMDAYLIAMDTSIAPGPSDPTPATPPLPSHSEQPQTANHRTRLETEEEEEETENTDAPPEKKV